MSEVIELPVKGMTKEPYGIRETPSMAGAFVACMFATLEQDECVKAFEEDSGLKVSLLTPKSPIDKMINDAANVSEKVASSFADWVAENIWGLAGEEE